MRDIKIKNKKCKCGCWEEIIIKPFHFIGKNKIPKYIRGHSLRGKSRYKGKTNPHWKGGRIVVGEYIYIYKPLHPFSTKDGYVAEHRLIMEKYIGRYLKKKEVVHHINNHGSDNIIENLKLFKNTGYHTVRHHIIRDNKGRFTSKCVI